jgi:hypothetical protein
MCNLYRIPSIVASYQVSVHLAEQFEKRRFYQIGQLETRIVCETMFVNGSGSNEQSLEKTFHSCIITSFGSFGSEVLEEKIFF